MFVASILTGVVGLNYGLMQLVTHADDPPSDQQMLADFVRREAALEQIVKMTWKDKNLQRATETDYYTDDGQKSGVTTARFHEYRALLQSVGMPEGFTTYRERQVEFFDFITGVRSPEGVSRGQVKSYVYTSVPPKLVLSSLDGLRNMSADYAEGYRPIKGKWYLHYVRLPY